MTKRLKPGPNKIFGTDIRNLSQLKQNDRFYFNGDPAKKVWQVVRPDVSLAIGRKVNVMVCKDDLNREQRYNWNRTVVYLRKQEGDSWIQQRKKTKILKLEF
jgi:hypothetical protein